MKNRTAGPSTLFLLHQWSTSFSFTLEFQYFTANVGNPCQVHIQHKAQKTSFPVYTVPESFSSKKED